MFTAWQMQVETQGDSLQLALQALSFTGAASVLPCRARVSASGNIWINQGTLIAICAIKAIEILTVARKAELICVGLSHRPWLP